MAGVLAGEDALDLWRQGKDAWNAWIEDNPGAFIDFRGADFGKERHADNSISFMGFKFGDGDVSFRGANFGDGGVSFKSALFGNGEAIFNYCKFGNGNKDFQYAVFNSKRLSFDLSEFGDRETSFLFAKFNGKDVSFAGAQFGVGPVTFTGTVFNCQNVCFIGTSFGSGMLSFWGITFGRTHISFMDAISEKGHFQISASSTESTEWNFERASFGGPFSFEWKKEFIAQKNGEKKTIKNVPISKFSLKGATFSSTLSLSGKFDCIPDLQMSKISHHIDLSKVMLKLRRRGCWIEDKTATESEDHVRLRRLKELAEGVKDHTSALKFSADENRAMRWIHRSPFQSDLDVLFSLTSNYGQSILRPFCGLTLAWAVAASILWIYAQEEAQARLLNSFLLSAAHTFSFLPSTKGIMEASTKALFGNCPPPWLSFLTLAESLLGFIFLFLIGLGLRNRFRL